MPETITIETGSKQNARICLVGDSEHMPLALSLSRAGHPVLLLNLADTYCPATPEYVTIDLAALYRPVHPYAPLRALLACHWLRRQEFDHILFARPAAAYYATIARDLGLDFPHTGLWIIGDAFRAVSLRRQRRWPDGRTDIELHFLEAEALRRADGLLLPEPQPGDLEAAGLRRPERCLTWKAGDPLPFPPSRSGKVVSGDIRISVCLPAFNRAPELDEAVRSLMAQTKTDFDVILVDDGSSCPDTLAVIERWRAPFHARGWTMVRQENAGPAKARRAARQAARGSHLLFMDDDNVALAHEIERFARAARSGADILTCIPGRHPASDLGPEAVAIVDGPDPSYPQVGIDWTPVGACPALAVMVNCLGDNNALVRAEVYDALDGHVDDRDFVFEDFHFLSTAVARGYRLEVVPEILFLYRRHRGSRSMREHLYASHLRSLEPWLALVPPSLRPLLVDARKAWYERHRAQAAESGGDQG